MRRSAMNLRMNKSVEPKDTKRMRLLLGTTSGINEEREALFVVQLMSRQDALEKTKKGEHGSYYMDEFTDYVFDIGSFMQRTKGKGRVFLSFAFVEADQLKKIAAELVERGEHGALTMAALGEVLEEFG